jgi:hypothetical protein
VQGLFRRKKLTLESYSMKKASSTAGEQQTLNFPISQEM